jgi:hypothetical protein
VNRLWQPLLVATLLPLCWLGMMAVHELGHVIGLRATGGTVAKVVLHPLTISRTDPGLDPRPLPVVWAGPFVGVLLPMAAAGVARLLYVPGRFLLQFFAGFCLIANGCYIGVGAFDPVGDARELLRLGTPEWQLAVFGLVCVPLGLFLWHGQGKHFRRENARPAMALSVAALLVIVLVTELLLSPDK